MQNSSNRIVPPPSTSIWWNLATGSEMGPTHYSIVSFASRNSYKSILPSPLESIFLNACQYSNLCLNATKNILNLSFSMKLSCFLLYSMEPFANTNALSIDGFASINLCSGMIPTKPSITPERGARPFSFFSMESHNFSLASIWSGSWTLQGSSLLIHAQSVCW